MENRKEQIAKSLEPVGISRRGDFQRQKIGSKINFFDGILVSNLYALGDFSVSILVVIEIHE